MDTYEEFVKVGDMEWTESSFAATRVEIGNPIKTNQDNVVYFCDEETGQMVKTNLQQIPRNPRWRKDVMRWR